MELFVDYHSGVPIYQQIQSQILFGSLETDTPLPSIRNLAKDLRISVITTKRAYKELENDGLIYSVPGKGNFVARQNWEKLREQYQREIEERMRQLLSQARSVGMTKREVQEILEQLWEEQRMQQLCCQSCCGLVRKREELFIFSASVHFVLLKLLCRCKRLLLGGRG